jgi:ring-1,2-phenylacetyl-CoA epoxidase subunit PaaE
MPVVPRAVRLLQVPLDPADPLALEGVADAPSRLPQFHTLRIDDITRETADAVSIRFAVPPGLAEAYRFTAGQYLTLRTRLDGTEIRRCYSICTAPGDGGLRVAVKRSEGGAFSAWANDRLAPGDAMEVMTPAGRFGVPLAPGAARVHVGFAAGSGITPILSIIRDILAHEPGSRFFLFYGNRTVRSILFRTALETLKDRYLDRLGVFHVLSQEAQDLPILHGRIDAAKTRLLLRHIVPAGRIDHAFICGPGGMSDSVESALADLGLPPERIHVERFAAPGQTEPRPAPRPDAPPAHVAAMIMDGNRRDIPVAAGESVLDAALRAGMDMPFACKGGMCSTCRARVVEGAVEMTVNYALEPWELAAGFVLTCQAHPTTPRVVIDYDHV